MKKLILTAAFICIALAGYSQSLTYNDIGTLISDDSNHGSSRFNAMSGAFGALGGDNSATNINPAGGAINKFSNFSITLGNTSTVSDANYYSKKYSINNNNFNFSSANGVFVLKNNKDSEWKRFALTLSYQLKNDFDDSFTVQGNPNSSPYFTENPHETNNYNKGITQILEKTNSGNSSSFNLGFSSIYKNNFLLGGAINFHSFNLTELNKLEEDNEDSGGNILNAFNVQETTYETGGISLSLGGIYKIENNLRIGLALETPTWYGEILEETNIFKQEGTDGKNFENTEVVGYTEITTTDSNGGNPDEYETNDDSVESSYSFSSPARVTGSIAYLFGKNGLISADYTFKNYKGMRYRGENGEFNVVNNSFSKFYRNTHALNVGTEWRYKEWWFRGGYHYETNPNLVLGGIVNTDNKQGFSTGIGYTFDNLLDLDLAYYQTKKTDFYKIYNNNDLSIDNNISRITLSATYHF